MRDGCIAFTRNKDKISPKVRLEISQYEKWKYLNRIFSWKFINMTRIIHNRFSKRSIWIITRNECIFKSIRYQQNNFVNDILLQNVKTLKLSEIFHIFTNNFGFNTVYSSFINSSVQMEIISILVSLMLANRIKTNGLVLIDSSSYFPMNFFISVVMWGES